MARLRRPGSPWRILVHEWLGKKHRSQGNDACVYGKAFDVTNDPEFGKLPASVIGAELRARLDADAAKHSETITLPGTEFDELVIGRWIHLEQKDSTRWWINLGGVTVWVTADRDGRPKHVSVYGPDDYAEREPGCGYSLAWGPHTYESED